MKRVTILTTFCDKDNFATVYQAGSEVEFTEERAVYLKRLGLVEFVIETGEAKPRAKREKSNTEE